MKKFILLFVIVSIISILSGYIYYRHNEKKVISLLLKNRKVKSLLLKSLRNYNRYKRLNAKNKGVKNESKKSISL